MKFPWHKYEEAELSRRNTLQIFVTNDCNLKCNGCFARNLIGDDKQHMSLEEYNEVVNDFLGKGGKQINLLGGEPLLHPELDKILKINQQKNLKTTIYTNGYFIDKCNNENLHGAKLRVSLYGTNKNKGTYNLPKTDVRLDANFMVGAKTTLDDLLDSAGYIENNHNCNVFFISSLRELDNPEKEFFYDTDICMPVLDYKKLVHDFLWEYEGDMAIHISKRGVFESTTTLPDNKCRFANYSIGGKIVQCPYDIVNLKFQKDYEFGKRHCQHNNSCLMSKIVLKKKEGGKNG